MSPNPPGEAAGISAGSRPACRGSFPLIILDPNDLAGHSDLWHDRPENAGLEVHVRAANHGAAEQEQGVAAWSLAAERFPPADRVLSAILTRQAARYGDRTLFVSGATRWTYAETASIAAASAHRLMEAGIRPGDRVALMCSNRPEFLQVYLGCAWMGAVTVPINTALRGIQLSHILRNSSPHLLVIEASLLPAIDTLDEGVSPPERIWTIGEGSTSARGSMPLPALGDGIPPAALRPGDTVAILYTSGTTGPAKACAARRRRCSVGRLFRAGARGPAARLVHDAAAVPHQRADAFIRRS